MRNNRRVHFILYFVALIFISTNLLTLKVNAATQIKRLAGQGRYETAICFIVWMDK